MKTILSLLLVVTITSCKISFNGKRGSGNVTTENRSISNFTKIKAEGVFKVYLKQTDVDGVKVETDDNLQEYIEVFVKDQTLMVRMKKNTSIGNSTKMNVYVSFKQVDEIVNSMVGNLESEGAINADKLTFISTAVGGTALDLIVNNLDMNISAVGNTKISGKAENCNFVNSAVGNFDGKDLLIKNLTLKNTAVGNTTYNALSEKIDNSAIGKTTNVNK